MASQMASASFASFLFDFTYGRMAHLRRALAEILGDRDNRVSESLAFSIDLCVLIYPGSE
jgi:hypothetical protein